MLELQRQREQLGQCSIAAALESVGERWSFLILRGAFNGLHHFEEFQTTLGIARNILSNRLAKLVEGGIMERVPDAADRRKVSYRLTEKGRDLLPVLLSLRQWGERWCSAHPSNPVLVDRFSRQPIAPMAVRSADGRTLALNELEWIDRSELR